VPVIRAFSFAYDDVPECDERDISSIVVRYFGQIGFDVPASDAWPLAEYPQHGPDPDGPDRFPSHVVFDRAQALASREGVTVLMSGQRGDAMFGRDIVDYVGTVRHAGIRAAWRDLTRHSEQGKASRGRLIQKYVVRRMPSTLWPRGRAAAIRRVVRRYARLTAFPPWLRRDAIDRLHLRDILEEARPVSGLPTEALRRRHHHILDPMAERSAELLERRFARVGMRHVDPWSDRRLAELALGVPQRMITPIGERKGLLREAMRGVIPEAVRVAAHKRTPRPAYSRGLVDRSVETIKSLIEGSHAAARGFVDERVLRERYAGFLTRSNVTHDEWFWLWRYLDVEDWLRRFAK
jgi:asparagine synthase (glutamine-hydrolysing)